MITAEDQMQHIHELVGKIMCVKNRYYITNICIKVVEYTFEEKKGLNPTEIRVLSIYPICINILTSMLEAGDNQYDNASAFLYDYRNMLMK